MDGLRISEHPWGALAHCDPRAERPRRTHVSALQCLRRTGNRVSPAGRELPDGSAVLIFNLGKELRVEDLGGACTPSARARGSSAVPARPTSSPGDGRAGRRSLRSSSACLGARLFLGRPLGGVGRRACRSFRRRSAVAPQNLESRGVAEARSQEEWLQLLPRAVDPMLRSQDAVAPELAFAFGPPQPRRCSHSLRSRATSAWAASDFRRPFAASSGSSPKSITLINLKKKKKKKKKKGIRRLTERRCLRSAATSIRRT